MVSVLIIIEKDRKKKERIFFSAPPLNDLAQSNGLITIQLFICSSTNEQLFSIAGKMFCPKRRCLTDTVLKN